MDPPPFELAQDTQREGIKKYPNLGHRKKALLVPTYTVGSEFSASSPLLRSTNSPKEDEEEAKHTESKRILVEAPYSSYDAHSATLQNHQTTKHLDDNQLESGQSKSRRPRTLPAPPTLEHTYPDLATTLLPAPRYARALESGAAYTEGPPAWARRRARARRVAQRTGGVFPLDPLDDDTPLSPFWSEPLRSSLATPFSPMQTPQISASSPRLSSSPPPSLPPTTSPAPSSPLPSSSPAPSSPLPASSPAPSSPLPASSTPPHSDPPTPSALAASASFETENFATLLDRFYALQLALPAGLRLERTDVGDADEEGEGEEFQVNGSRGTATAERV